MAYKHAHSLDWLDFDIVKICLI